LHRKNDISHFHVTNHLERLKKLELLVLENNRLESLPSNLFLMKASLQFFNVQGNPLLGESASCYEGEKLIELYVWLREFESGSTRQNILKVLLLGEGI